MNPAPVFRINKFAVPTQSRGEFLDFIVETQAVISAQPGFVRASMMEQYPGPGIFNFVALLEFSGPEAVDPIIAAIADYDRAQGIDRPAVMAGLGVKVDMGNYRALELT
ncbi:hypothetical protein ACFSM5_13910 [Lacibacterium aquatile]|uniref:Antibiotic biosynthesis monooxygenase n=1 Tax=Lacibacterium aquatile TaxID=1168082 RepID=A0ABW5DS62_9PROT